LLNVLLLHVKKILVRFATASFWKTYFNSLVSDPYNNNV
jgi:hypothetical protein